MEVFRISTENYSTALTASGAANRWNKEKEFVIYAGASRSLSTLELVVHRSAIKPLFAYKVMVISFADEDLVEEIRKKDLPKGWRFEAAYPLLQEMGSEWYHSKKSLVLKIPSAIIPQENNYIINTTHPEFAKSVSLVRTEDYFWDDRLLKV